MITGAETPIAGSILAGARLGLGGDFLVAGQTHGDNKSIESYEHAPDTIEFSPEAINRLQDLQKKLSQGRGDPERQTQTARVKGAGGLLKNIEEYQQSLDDENRIPPSLIKQIEGMLQAALEPDPAPRLNKLA